MSAAPIITPKLRKALFAIAEGYFAEGIDDRFISVENPDCNPDGGDPYIIIDLYEVFGDEEAEAA
jgi:hypothetical protein